MDTKEDQVRARLKAEEDRRNQRLAQAEEKQRAKHAANTAEYKKLLDVIERESRRIFALLEPRDWSHAELVSFRFNRPKRWPRRGIKWYYCEMACLRFPPLGGSSEEIRHVSSANKRADFYGYLLYELLYMRSDGIPVIWEPNEYKYLTLRDWFDFDADTFDNEYNEARLRMECTIKLLKAYTLA